MLLRKNCAATDPLCIDESDEYRYMAPLIQAIVIMTAGPGTIQCKSKSVVKSTQDSNIPFRGMGYKVPSEYNI